MEIPEIPSPSMFTCIRGFCLGEGKGQCLNCDWIWRCDNMCFHANKILHINGDIQCVKIMLNVYSYTILGILVRVQGFVLKMCEIYDAYFDKIALHALFTFRTFCNVVW